MKVLMIGNGFDLAHGLETKYTDFLKFVEQFNRVYDINERDSDFYLRSGNFMQFLVSLFRDNSIESRHIIKEFRQITLENIWVNHFNEVLDVKKNIGENWIDFEKEIERVIGWMEKSISTCKSFMDIVNLYEREHVTVAFLTDLNIEIEKFKFTKSSNTEELEKRLIKKYLNDLDNLIRALEIYFTLYVYSQIRENFNDDIISLKLGENDAIISFNYTDTYNKIYKNNLIAPENIHFIHGNAVLHNNGNNNMVVGIDETLEGDEINKNLKYVGFKKYFQRIVKDVDASYTNLFKLSEDEYNEKIEVFVFGHSLDKTDSDIIRRIFTAKNSIVTVFSHDHDAQKQQVANLISIIGKDELLNSTYRSEPKIRFRIQKKEVN
ncbi:MAG: AbiH family protein [Anaerovoracaceae bacterium]